MDEYYYNLYIRQYEAYLDSRRAYERDYQAAYNVNSRAPPYRGGPIPKRPKMMNSNKQKNKEIGKAPTTPQPTPADKVPIPKEPSKQTNNTPILLQNSKQVNSASVTPHSSGEVYNLPTKSSIQANKAAISMQSAPEDNTTSNRHFPGIETKHSINQKTIVKGSHLYKDKVENFIETITTSSTTVGPEESQEFKPCILTTITTTVDFSNKCEPAEETECSPNTLTEPVSEDESYYDPEQSPLMYIDTILSDEEISDNDIKKSKAKCSKRLEETLSSLETEAITSDEESLISINSNPSTSKQHSSINKQDITYAKSISSDDDSVEMTILEPCTFSESTLYDPYVDTFSTINMVIVLWNYPHEKFINEQEVNLRNALLKEVWKCEQGTSPKFEDNYFQNGAMHIICANEDSRKWLLDKVPRMQPWKGAVLRVGTKEEIYKNKKFKVWIPKEAVDMTDVIKILELLEKQNARICTKNWCIINSETDPKGISLILSVDHESWGILGDMKWQPYLGLGQIEFKVAE